MSAWGNASTLKASYMRRGPNDTTADVEAATPYTPPVPAALLLRH